MHQVAEFPDLKSILKFASSSSQALPHKAPDGETCLDKRGYTPSNASVCMRKANKPKTIPKQNSTYFCLKYNNVESKNATVVDATVAIRRTFVTRRISEYSSVDKFDRNCDISRRNNRWECFSVERVAGEVSKIKGLFAAGPARVELDAIGLFGFESG